jgi:hypothetical protein
VNISPLGPTIGWDGSIFYKVNGQFHNEHGPAIEYPDGRKFWYIDGQFHRLDGPAIEYRDGVKLWYINGVDYSFDEFVIKANWTTEQIVIWKLHYC